MTQKTVSLLELTQNLQEKRHQKHIFHDMLIEANREAKRLKKIGEVADKADASANNLKTKIAELNSAIRALEHDVSILTVLMCQQATIEETAYGRTIKYHTNETEEDK